MKVKILWNHLGRFLSIAKFLPDRGSFTICILEYLASGSSNFQRALLVNFRNREYIFKRSPMALNPIAKSSYPSVHSQSSADSQGKAMIEPHQILLIISREQATCTNTRYNLEQSRHLQLAWTHHEPWSYCYRHSQDLKFNFIPSLIPFNEGRALFFNNSIVEATTATKKEAPKMPSTILYLNNHHRLVNVIDTVNSIFLGGRTSIKCLLFDSWWTRTFKTIAKQCGEFLEVDTKLKPSLFYLKIKSEWKPHMSLLFCKQISPKVETNGLPLYLRHCSSWKMLHIWIQKGKSFKQKEIHQAYKNPRIKTPRISPRQGSTQCTLRGTIIE